MSVLIPSRIADDACKTIMPLNFFGFIVWSGIENDDALEKVIKNCRAFSKKSDEELAKRIEDYCRILYEKGFVVRRSDPRE